MWCFSPASNSCCSGRSHTLPILFTCHSQFPMTYDIFARRTCFIISLNRRARLDYNTSFTRDGNVHNDTVLFVLWLCWIIAVLFPSAWRAFADQ